MTQDSSGYKHSASDKKLDQAATADAAAVTDTTHGSGQGHDADQVRQHDDSGKDRLFEGRAQHDDAEKQSERNRLDRDVQKHDHGTDDDANTGTTSADIPRS